MLVIDGDSAPAETLAGVSGRAPAARDRLATLAGGGVPAETLGFPSGATVGWHKDGGALARFADGTAAIAVRRVGTGIVVLLGAPLDQARDGARRRASPAPPTCRPATSTSATRMALVARTLYGLTPTGVVARPGARRAAPPRWCCPTSSTTPAASPASPQVAAIERDRGARATFLVVTRTAGSGGTPELTATQAAMLAALARGGFDVAAAGVAPEAIARRRPAAAPRPTRATRRPPTRGGTTLSGEARVGRHILGALDAPPAGAVRPAAAGARAGVGDRLEDAARREPATPPTWRSPAPAVGGTRAVPTRRDRLGGATERAAAAPAGGVRRRSGRPASTSAAPSSTPLVAHAVATGAPATVRIAPAGGTTATFALQRLLAGVTPDVWTGDATTFARFWSARYGLDRRRRAGRGRLRRPPRRPRARCRRRR